MHWLQPVPESKRLKETSHQKVIPYFPYTASPETLILDLKNGEYIVASSGAHITVTILGIHSFRPGENLEIPSIYLKLLTFLQLLWPSCSCPSALTVVSGTQPFPSWLHSERASWRTCNRRKEKVHLDRDMKLEILPLHKADTNLVGLIIHSAAT